MLIKINNKPIHVTEESQDSQSKSWLYYCVSYTGYLFILYLLDYVCYTFFYFHPLPWITWVGKILLFIGGLF